MRRPGCARSGFSLAELLLIMVVISILAGIALPTLRRAIDRADAARVISDVRHVTLAARQYLENNTGALPATTAWGVTPTDLDPYLPPGSAFTYKTTSYRLVSSVALGTVRMEVGYAIDDPIGVALQSYAGQDVTWTNTRLTVWIQR